MALTEEEFRQIIAGVDVAMGKRLEEVYGAIEQLREEFQATINVIDGSIMSIIGWLQEREDPEVKEFSDGFQGAWDRLVKMEAERLGLIIDATKRARTKGRVG